MTDEEKLALDVDFVPMPVSSSQFDGLCCLACIILCGGSVQGQDSARHLGKKFLD